MDIKINQLDMKQVDTIVLPYYKVENKGMININLGDEINTKVEYIINEEKFSGKDKEIKVIELFRKENPKKIILLGLGSKEELDGEKVRKCIGKAIKECKKLKSEYIQINLDNLDESFVKEYTKELCEGAILSNYKFDKYKSDRKESTINTVSLEYSKSTDLSDIEEKIKEGTILANATIIARYLVNEPANKLGPVELANETINIGNESNFEVEIYDENKIEELGMKAYLEVARASSNPPRFIVMRYTGDKDNKDNIIGLVGKGLTYDSGGLSIKPTNSMAEMKSDMGGAAAVIGAMSAISKMKLKANVVAVVAACENMISGNAYRPGDIIGSMAGKTIEVLNTDAEGRLTLVDAVHYIIEKEGVNKVIDIATLTGAALVALGTITTAVISNDDDLYSCLEKSSKEAGEKIWRLPNFPEYKELIKSDNADLKNVGGKDAGTITAGLFIGEFVQDKPWIHMDIAGTSWSNKDLEYISKGGTGAGVRTLYYLIKNLA
ncbi:leucyl aminopeptidase [Alkalithermobacter paradoxus]|uniref:Probable cytosol aminopeptidase n=1 Tax=Alkalithermobacter paradoxus TaxID=29349 RepID=A0A1V4I3U1_9FIRM|nr:cytosol aminopeptidase [[Clostridium] thermoalcaliphilum]